MSLFQTDVISDEDEKFGNLGHYMYNKTERKKKPDVKYTA